jgi:hypothetical protein
MKTPLALRERKHSTAGYSAIDCWSVRHHQNHLFAIFPVGVAHPALELSGKRFTILRYNSILIFGIHGSGLGIAPQ